MHNLVDNLLLVKMLEYKTTQSLQQCIENLRKLQQPRKGFFWKKSVEVTVREENPERFEVDIRLKRPDRAGAVTTAYATGVLTVDANSRTLFQGKVSLGRYNIWSYVCLTILLVLLFLFSLSNLSSLICSNRIIFVGLISFFISILVSELWKDKADYDDLTMQIVDAIQYGRAMH